MGYKEDRTPHSEQGCFYILIHTQMKGFIPEYLPTFNHVGEIFYPASMKKGFIPIE